MRDRVQQIAAIIMAHAPNHEGAVFDAAEEIAALAQPLPDDVGEEGEDMAEALMQIGGLLHDFGCHSEKRQVRKAADLITALQARVAGLEGALKQIEAIDLQWADGLDANVERIKTIARAALKGD